ncbi:unnamed protein product, partial [marine sediment metagenome]
MNTVHLADCLPAMREMEDNAYDLAVVDPPYGIGEGRGQYKSRNANRIDRRNGKQIQMRHPGYKSKEWDKAIPSREYFLELDRISSNRIIWGGQYFTEYLPPSSGWVVWDKVNGKSDFADCELAWT